MTPAERRRENRVFALAFLIGALGMCLAANAKQDVRPDFHAEHMRTSASRG